MIRETNSVSRHYHLKVLAASTLLAVSTQLFAGLGALQVHSNLGQPFSGSIYVDGDEAQILLKDQAALSVSGAQLIKQVVPADNGAIVYLRSETPVKEPLFNFVISVGSQGRLYTAVIDPSDYQHQDGRRNKTGKKHSGSSTVESGIASIFSGQNYTTHAHETLLDIARHVRPQKMTLRQTATALVRANPHAFRNGNPDFMYEGVVLRIPSVDEMYRLAQQSRASSVKDNAVNQKDSKTEATSVVKNDTQDSQSVEKVQKDTPSTDTAPSADSVADTVATQAATSSKEGMSTTTHVETSAQQVGDSVNDVPAVPESSPILSQEQNSEAAVANQVTDSVSGNQSAVSSVTADEATSTDEEGILSILTSPYVLGGVVAVIGLLLLLLLRHRSRRQASAMLNSSEMESLLDSNVLHRQESLGEQNGFAAVNQDQEVLESNLDDVLDDQFMAKTDHLDAEQSPMLSEFESHTTELGSALDESIDKDWLAAAEMMETSADKPQQVKVIADDQDDDWLKFDGPEVASIQPDAMEIHTHHDVHEFEMNDWDDSNNLVSHEANIIKAESESKSDISDEMSWDLSFATGSTSENASDSAMEFDVPEVDYHLSTQDDNVLSLAEENVGSASENPMSRFSEAELADVAFADDFAQINDVGYSDVEASHQKENKQPAEDSEHLPKFDIDSLSLADWEDDKSTESKYSFSSESVISPADHHAHHKGKDLSADAQQRHAFAVSDPKSAVVELDWSTLTSAVTNDRSAESNLLSTIEPVSEPELTDTLTYDDSLDLEKEQAVEPVAVQTHDVIGEVDSQIGITTESESDESKSDLSAEGSSEHRTAGEELVNFVPEEVVASTDSLTEVDDHSSDDEGESDIQPQDVVPAPTFEVPMEAKLELAKMYLEIDDAQTARQTLQELVEEASGHILEEAQSLLHQLG